MLWGMDSDAEIGFNRSFPILFQTIFQKDKKQRGVHNKGRFDEELAKVVRDNWVCKGQDYTGKWEN